MSWHEEPSTISQYLPHMSFCPSFIALEVVCKKGCLVALQHLMTWGQTYCTTNQSIHWSVSLVAGNQHTIYKVSTAEPTMLARLLMCSGRSTAIFQALDSIGSQAQPVSLASAQGSTHAVQGKTHCHLSSIWWHQAPNTTSKLGKSWGTYPQPLPPPQNWPVSSVRRVAISKQILNAHDFTLTIEKDMCLSLSAIWCCWQTLCGSLVWTLPEENQALIMQKCMLMKFYTVLFCWHVIYLCLTKPNFEISRFAQLLAASVQFSAMCLLADYLSLFYSI